MVKNIMELSWVCVNKFIVLFNFLKIQIKLNYDWQFTFVYSKAALDYYLCVKVKFIKKKFFITRPFSVA